MIFNRIILFTITFKKKNLFENNHKIINNGDIPLIVSPTIYFSISMNVSI